MRLRKSRLPCHFDVTIRIDGVQQDITLVNISASGALIRGLGRTRFGSRVMFELLGLPIHADVARMGVFGATGLRFTRPLNRRQIDTILGIDPSDRMVVDLAKEARPQLRL